MRPVKSDLDSYDVPGLIGGGVCGRSYLGHWDILCLTLGICVLWLVQECLLYYLFSETGSYYISQIDLEFLTLLPPVPECWNYALRPPGQGTLACVEIAPTFVP